MSPSAEQTRPASAGRSWGRRTAAAGIVGATILASLLLGAGAAGAAPALTCPSGQKPVVGLLGPVCRVVGGTVGGVTGAVPEATAPVRSAVPKVVAPVRTAVPRVVGGATGRVAPAPAAATGSSRSAGATPAPASASAAPAAVPAAAAAPAPAPAGAVAPVTPLAADTSLVSSFGVAPAGLLAATGPTPSLGAFGALTSAAPGGRGYDPGLLLATAQPARQFLPGPVTTSSTAQPLALLAGDGRIGTPVLVAVLAAAVLLALGVRAAVLRRARARTVA